MTPLSSFPPIDHYDPSQLVYQMLETVEERVYLRHGVTVNEGDVVFDVGANVGVAAIFFAVECGAGTIHSFEPVAPLYDYLVKNTRSIETIEPHLLGLSSHGGTSTIAFYPGAAAMSGLYADPAIDRAFAERCVQNLELPVEATAPLLRGFDEVRYLDAQLDTLSSVLRATNTDQIDLLKIDVERAELDVLDGIADDDWSAIRQVVVEVHDVDQRLRVVTNRLQRFGFAIAVDQDAAMRGTEVHLVYARR